MKLTIMKVIYIFTLSFLTVACHSHQHSSKQEHRDTSSGQEVKREDQLKLLFNQKSGEEQKWMLEDPLVML